MSNSSIVLSAWYNEELIGLIRSLDDGATTAFIHYVLVKPEFQKFHIGGTLLQQLLSYIMPSNKALIPFYQAYGFKRFDNYCAMEIKRFNTLKD